MHQVGIRLLLTVDGYGECRFQKNHKSKISARRIAAERCVLWSNSNTKISFEKNKKEVDFVALKDDNILYVQATYLLVDENTINREYSPLEQISDNYEKVVVSLDDITFPHRDGIKHIQAWNFRPWNHSNNPVKSPPFYFPSQRYSLGQDQFEQKQHHDQ